ncbi:anti-repressor SinI family protein [Gracilibacillus sp. S3-1-1]|uniref:Anti-repressor SinI family protein n=1 Tax=Gracilibacillus pellucidus TaxID=3095368 RepID=A0ACC6M6Q9_9BACI|nr:anti-repressor SinI family protein [Gracilibacillus sp. S3-1-1]MDX8046576.1 anti-repressor SinI family protein [Gracilibacillus sp. S3-1-1]
MGIKAIVDLEWICLMVQAKEKGYTIAEIRDFLRKRSYNKPD